MASDNSSVSQLVFFSGSVAVGTAIAYLLYQQYNLTQKQQYLSLQNAILSEKLVRLEKDVSMLKESHWKETRQFRASIKQQLLLSTPEEDHGDDVFVDAPDVHASDISDNK